MSKAKLLETKVLGKSLIAKIFEMDDGTRFYILSKFTSRGVQSISLFPSDIEALRQEFSV